MDVGERSFEAAAGASKLMITLSTSALGVGLAVLNVEFGKPSTLSPVSTADKVLIGVGLIVLLVALAIGFWTQLGITHVLSDGARGGTEPDAWDRRIVLPFQLQIVTFLLGVITFVAYGLIRLAG